MGDTMTDTNEIYRDLLVHDFVNIGDIIAKEFSTSQIDEYRDMLFDAIGTVAEALAFAENNRG